MLWEDFYERVFYWADSTKINKLYSLEDFGDSEEVFEVAMEYSFISDAQCTRFLRKAISSGVKLSPENPGTRS